MKTFSALKRNNECRHPPIVRLHVDLVVAVRERPLVEDPARLPRPPAARLAARARRVRQTTRLLPATATARTDTPRPAEVLRVEVGAAVSAEEVVALVVVVVA